MATVGRGARSEKVRQIFERFDRNGDGGLNREEMAALVVAVNPRVKFSDDQISAILDEVFRTYAEFIEPGRGLTLDGLVRTYDDGAGDVDRDFESLSLGNAGEITAVGGVGSAEPGTTGAGIAGSPSSLFDDGLLSASASKPAPARVAVAPWAASPNHGISFDSSWSLLEDLEILVKRLRSKQLQKAAISGTPTNVNDGNSSVNNNTFDSFSDAGWSREIAGPNESSSSLVERRVVWDETSRDYLAFVKEVALLRNRADAARSREEALDNHMTMGRVLYEHRLYRDALISFRRACELVPTDVRPHFRLGNSLYALGRHAEAKEEFLLALEAAEAGGSQASDILPQIHVNLGIAMEAEGMVLNACEHYREAAILCPSHFRALKLLGSALFGVGEYRAAEKALEEAIYLKPDYADAHCDLGSALHAMGEDDRAIQEFQKAIDLKPGHVDALYNLGGLYMDKERFARAAEMYTRVLSVRPGSWRAQLNRAVALLGQGESEEGKKALKDAFKMTKRVELYDAISHLKTLQKKKKKKGGKGGSESETEVDADFVIAEPSKFKRVNGKTTLRQDLANALDIRGFQRLTRLNRCDVGLLRKEMNETDVPISYSGAGVPEKSIRKAALEVIIRRLLKFLKPDTFQGAVKAINERVLSVLDASGSGRVDLGLFFAILAPICAGSPDQRKRVVFDALIWRPANEPGATEVRRNDALTYIKLLRAVYIPSHGVSDMLEMHGESDPTMVPYHEFLEMFNDPDWGFGILTTLVKLEEGDRIRHGRQTCSICRYPIIGSRFKETKQHFSLCNRCYSEGKVPSAYKVEEYRFKEYGKESEALKDKCLCFSSNSKNLDGDT
ncbi:Calcium-binding tetratricopeptide family protein [Rhynchospora pubera]|uniref:Calcium-binding tetratricopeptide family protein n=1 Tax=Rhynchospora pubera TaxID=906938 RepID=A0AAV8DIW3_9POAL|nr:Calcium-binding tetratricopeptide family protein [Rhynchospora pubera]